MSICKNKFLYIIVNNSEHTSHRNDLSVGVHFLPIFAAHWARRTGSRGKIFIMNSFLPEYFCTIGSCITSHVAEIFNNVYK